MADKVYIEVTDHHEVKFQGVRQGEQELWSARVDDDGYVVEGLGESKTEAMEDLLKEMATPGTFLRVVRSVNGKRFRDEQPNEEY